MMINQKKINILNIAWIGQGNFGDELMSFLIRIYLKNRGINRITYYSKGPHDIAVGPDDIKFGYLHRHRTKMLLKRMLDNYYLRKFNVLLIGGGSILHSYLSISWKLEVMKKMIATGKTSKFSGCIGVSLGPLADRKTEEQAEDFMKTVDFSVFRDKYSVQLAQRLSDRNNFIPSSDIAFLLGHFYREKINSLAQRNKGKDLVGLILINTGRPEDMEIYRSIIEGLVKKGKRVMLFTLDLSAGPGSDRELSDLLVRPADAGRIQRFDYDGDMFRLIDVLSGCSHIISMKFHGIILAYMLAIPFVSIGKNIKNINFCLDVNYLADLVIDFNSSSGRQIDAAVERLLECGKETFDSVLPCGQLAESVKRNLDILFDMIEKKIC